MKPDGVQMVLTEVEPRAPLAQRFLEWVHTPEGGQVADRFIRLAIGVHRRGQKVGAKEIWERLRWHYSLSRGGDKYGLNNVYTAYMARFAMERAPELQGFFETRKVNRPKGSGKRWALVMPAEGESVGVTR